MSTCDQLAGDLERIAIAYSAVRELQLAARLISQLPSFFFQVEDLRKTADTLRHALSESEEKTAELKDSAAHKEIELSELRRIEQELKTEKDSVEKEKLDLSVKLQEARKEVNEQISRVAEYLSINEELLDFAQRKENEVCVETV